jgi:hypothetical protein
MYSILKLIIFIPFLFVAYTLWILGNNQTPMPGGELKYDNCFQVEDKNIIAAFNGKCAIHNEVRGVTDVGSVVDSLYNTNVILEKGKKRRLRIQKKMDVFHSTDYNYRINLSIYR